MDYKDVNEALQGLRGDMQSLEEGWKSLDRKQSALEAARSDYALATELLEAELAQGRLRKRQLRIASIVSAAMLLLAVFFTLLPPFHYTAHGINKSEYCPGDRLDLWFRGVSHSFGRGVVVSGYLQGTDELSYARYFYPDETFNIPFSIHELSQVVEYRARVLPEDIEPGRYFYYHSNRARFSFADQVVFGALDVLEPAACAESRDGEND